MSKKKLKCNERRKGFLKSLKEKAQDKSALGTIEIVIIIAVLMAVALIFREQLTSFAESLMSKVFDQSILDGLG